MEKIRLKSIKIRHHDHSDWYVAGTNSEGNPRILHIDGLWRVSTKSEKGFTGCFKTSEEAQQLLTDYRQSLRSKKDEAAKDKASE